MSITTGTIPGVRIIDMPDLGALNDSSSVVGERAGSGRFSALALRAYVGISSVATIAALRALTSGAAAVFVQGYYAAGDSGGGIYSRGASGADNGGSVIVSPSGTYYLQTFGGPVSLTQFGASTTIADNSTAIQAWLDALSAAGLVGHIPPGVFAFATERTIHTNTRIMGAGRNVAVLRGTTANMTMLSLFNATPINTSIHLSDFSFDGGADGITGLATKYAWSMFVERVDFTGTAWTAKIEAAYFVTIKDINVRGNAARAGGQLMLFNNTGDAGASGYCTIESYMNDCSGVWGMGSPGSQTAPLILIKDFEASTLINCQALSLDQPTANAIGHIEIRGLCQGWEIVGGLSVGASVGILLISPPDGLGYVSIDGYSTDKYTTAGILLSGDGLTHPVEYIQITGGFITSPLNNPAPGIVLSYANYVVVTGVTFQNSTTFHAGVGVQINNSSLVTVNGCSFSVLDKGVSLTGTCNRATITDNHFNGCNSNITDASAHPNGHIFWPNQWTGLPAPVLPTLPASGVELFNDTGYPLMVFVSGGTVTAIAMNNTTVTGLTSGSFYLSAGDNHSIKLVYSAAPNWQVSVVP